MSSIIFLIFLSLCVGAGAFALFLYANKDKQFEDIEAPKHRMMNDDDKDGLL